MQLSLAAGPDVHRRRPCVVQFPTTGFVAARDTAQKHPILSEFHQRVVSVEAAHHLSQPIEHTSAGAFFAGLNVDMAAMHRDRPGMARDHVLLLLPPQPPCQERRRRGRVRFTRYQEPCRVRVCAAKWLGRTGLRLSGGVASRGSAFREPTFETFQPRSPTTPRATNRTLAGRSASRRMKYGNHSRPKGT